MSRVAGQLRAELRERIARLPAGERLQLALRLGARDVEMYARARCVDSRTAADVLQAARRSGRRPSRCMVPKSS